MADGKEYIVHCDENGNINISEEVVATIAAAAAKDVDGVNGLAQNVGRKGTSRGVKIAISSEGVSADIYIFCEADMSVSEVAKAVQARVVSEIESSIGATVKAVNIHVAGIVFNK